MKHKSLQRALSKIGSVEKTHELYSGQTHWRIQIKDKVVKWHELSGEVIFLPLCIYERDEKCIDYGYEPKTIKACVDWLTS